MSLQNLEPSSSSANERSPSLSPDERFLAYSSDESGRDEVYVQSFPGGNANQTDLDTFGQRKYDVAADGERFLVARDDVDGDPQFTVVEKAAKTTAARAILARHDSENLLFKWDVPATRQRYRQDTFFYRSLARDVRDPWLCFDEIHKERQWKNILKGSYDEDGLRLHILVTGSARLELFRRAGDSLAGRFFLFSAHRSCSASSSVKRLRPPRVRRAGGSMNGYRRARTRRLSTSCSSSAPFPNR